MRDSVKIVIACIVCLGVVGAAGIYVYFARNKDVKEREIEYSTIDNRVVWRYKGEGEDAWETVMELDPLKGKDGKIPEIVNDGKYLKFQNEDGEWVNIIKLDELAGSQGKTGAQGAQGNQGNQGIQGEKGEDGRTPEFRVNGDFVQWKYTNDNDWKTLVALSTLTGEKGSDGRSVDIRNNGTDIVWRYAGESDSPWRPIIQVAALKGDIGPTGIPGEKGDKGINGREVQLQTVGDIIQWRYTDEDDSAWKPLIAKADITGVPGVDAKNISLQSNGTEIQWKRDGEDWQTLVSLEAIRGPQGLSGSNGANGKKVELKKFDAIAPVAEDPSNNITAYPGRDAMIMYRYEGEGDDAWQELVKLSEISGKDYSLTDLGDLRVKEDVDTGAVDPNTGDPILENQIQYKGKNDPDDDAYWKRLCALNDLNVTMPSTKESYSSTGNTINLDSNKTYLVTMTISGTNNSGVAYTTTVTCNSNSNWSVSGTWLAPTEVDPTDPSKGTIGFTASYSTSFIVSGESALDFGSTTMNGMLLDVTVTEV